MTVEHRLPASTPATEPLTAGNGDLTG